MNKGTFAILIILGVVIVFLIWGLIGQGQANDIGVTCDFGIDDTFCWSWHTNTVGEIDEFFENLIDDGS